MKHFMALGVVATLAATVAAPASAGQYVINYYGIVDGGTDNTGVFGPASSSLVGATFNASFILTYPTPGVLSQAGANRDGVLGGSYYGVQSPVSGSYTINGTKLAITGDYVGYATQWNNATSTRTGLVYDQVAHGAQENHLQGGYGYHSKVAVFAYTLALFGQMLNSTNITDSLDYTLTPNDGGGGDFFVYDSFFNGSYRVYTKNASGTVSIDRVTIGSVPEPASWAMLIIGFGVVGGLQRNARRRVAVANC